jgi:hypothetical protein
MHWKLLGVLILLWLGSFYWSELVTLTFIILGLYSLKGSTQIIQAFSIISLLQLINPGIAIISNNSLKWMVITLPFLWIIVHFFNSPYKNLNKFSLANTHLTFGFFLLPLCLISSYHPTISTLKLLAFMAAGFTILKSFELSDSTLNYWQNWFNTLFTFILFGSLCMLLTPYGYFRNGRGFQGIFNHPQVLGVIAGLSSIWFFSQQKSLLKYTLGGLSLILVFFSKARIGFILIVASTLLLIVLQTIFDKRIRLNSGVKTLMIFLFIIGIPTFLLLEDSTELMRHFFLKRTPQSGLMESFGESRGHLIQKSLDNFFQNPLTGIGLGVNSDFNFNSAQLSNTLDIPLSAPTEKGFMPSAILEELGILGAVLTLGYLIVISLKIPFSNSSNYAWLYFATLSINLGEFVFFSFGGLGLFQWLLIAFCCTLDK